MGRQILCPHCKSTFDEDILSKRENPNICPICEESLVDDVDSAQNKTEELNFGEGIELGENDSFEEEDIDFWWYEIDNDSEDGYVSTTCVKCGKYSIAPYPISKYKNYVLIDSRYTDTCSKCGNEMKNHILSKRPADYVNPRQRETFITYDKVPRCPICHSSQIHKISATNKVASALTFGVFAAGHVSKTFKCDTCGAKF